MNGLEFFSRLANAIKEPLILVQFKTKENNFLDLLCIKIKIVCKRGRKMIYSL